MRDARALLVPPSMMRRHGHARSLCVSLLGASCSIVQHDFPRLDLFTRVVALVHTSSSLPSQDDGLLRIVVVLVLDLAARCRHHQLHECLDVAKMKLSFAKNDSAPSLGDVNGSP
jgi:hypothetical protein